MKKIILLLCVGTFISCGEKKEEPLSYEEMVAPLPKIESSTSTEPISTPSPPSGKFRDVGDKDIACSMAKDFIKQDLQNPATADFDLLDCRSEKNYDSSYTVMRKVSAKNSLGVEKEYIYKIIIGFTGGEKYDRSSWTLVSMRSEEYR